MVSFKEHFSLPSLCNLCFITAIHKNSPTERSSRTSHKSLKIDSVHRPHRRQKGAAAGTSGSRYTASSVTSSTTGQAVPSKQGPKVARGRNSPSPQLSSTHVNVSAIRGGTSPLEARAGTSTSVEIESGSRGSSSVVYRANVSVSSLQPSTSAAAGHGRAGGSHRGSSPTTSRHRPMNL